MVKTKGGFFQKVRCVFQISKKDTPKTILNLKFKFPANNTLLFLSGNWNFKLRIVFWNVFWEIRRFWKKALLVVRPWRKQNPMLRPREVANKRKTNELTHVGKRGPLMNANTILWCLFVYCANMPKHAVHSAVKVIWHTLIKIMERKNSKTD